MNSIVKIVAVAVVVAGIAGAGAWYDYKQKDAKIPRVLVTGADNFYHEYAGCSRITGDATKYRKPDVIARGYQWCPECTKE